MIPPLLNDFIGLQKDTALVGTLGAVEAFQQSQIDANATFNFTRVPRRRGALRRDHDPARALHRLADPARPPAPAGERARGMTEALAVDGLHKSFGKHEVLRGIDLVGRRARGRLPDRRVRLGQVDAPPLHQPARADRRAAGSYLAGEEITRAARRERGAPADRHRLPVVQPLPAHERAAERHARAARRARALEARRRGAGDDAARRASAWPTSATTTPTGSRAASSSASRSCARSRCSPS